MSSANNGETSQIETLKCRVLHRPTDYHLLVWVTVPDSLVSSRREGVGWHGDAKKDP